MKKSQWYKDLFSRIDEANQKEFFFESAFISYGIIEDRLTSIIDILGLPKKQGVSKKITAITKVKSTKLETAFGLTTWNGVEYQNLGIFGEVIEWCKLYRNPLQHSLGDPRIYHALFGNFHNENTKDLALEGRKIARHLSTAVMKFKK